MKRALIRPDKCTNCMPCEVEGQCENQAVLREEPDERPWVDFYRCSGCMKCKAVCVCGAIEEIAQPCDGRARLGW
jgi:Pyruvate/2-oxoacid:ferredoxin oxidoreductase delta subunit